MGRSGLNPGQATGEGLVARRARGGLSQARAACAGHTRRPADQRIFSAAADLAQPRPVKLSVLQDSCSISRLTHSPSREAAKHFLKKALVNPDNCPPASSRANNRIESAKTTGRMGGSAAITFAKGLPFSMTW